MNNGETLWPQWSLSVAKQFYITDADLCGRSLLSLFIIAT